MVDTVGVIAALVGFVGFSGIALVFGWVWRLSEHLSTLRGDVVAAQKRSEEAFALSVESKNALNAFRIEAAQRFVTDEMLVKVEERVIAAIDRLSDRLDRAFEGRQRTSRAKSEE